MREHSKCTHNAGNVHVNLCMCRACACRRLRLKAHWFGVGDGHKAAKEGLVCVVESCAREEEVEEVGAVQVWHLVLEQYSRLSETSLIIAAFMHVFCGERNWSQNRSDRQFPRL